MYIFCTSTKEKTFVRFGKRFKHGKSINYLAMNPRIKDIYSERLADLQYGYVTEEEFNAWCEEALDSFVWETNTSCFYCDPVTNFPVIKNVSQAKTLIGFIQRFEADLPCQAFLVKGTQVGTGTDGEPLVDVTYEEPIDYDTDDLIDVVVDALSLGFEVADKSRDNYSDNFIHLKGPAFLYKDNLFIYPKASFIKDWEYTGPVMDKLKFESEVSMDYDNLTCVFVDAEDNGGKEEVGEMIYEWGDTVYEKPYYFENKYRVAISILNNGDIYVFGQYDDVDDFLCEYPVDYTEIDVSSNEAQKLEKRFRTMKFYE